jgi:hypothetical protein
MALSGIKWRRIRFSGLFDLVGGVIRDAQPLDRARRLRAYGWPYRRIAKNLGVSPATVVNYVKTKAEE